VGKKKLSEEELLVRRMRYNEYLMGQHEMRMRLISRDQVMAGRRLEKLRRKKGLDSR
jgi:hypothetical protein